MASTNRSSILFTWVMHSLISIHSSNKLHYSDFQFSCLKKKICWGLFYSYWIWIHNAPSNRKKVTSKYAKANSQNTQNFILSKYLFKTFLYIVLKLIIFCLEMWKFRCCFLRILVLVQEIWILHRQYEFHELIEWK